MSGDDRRERSNLGAVFSSDDVELQDSTTSIGSLETDASRVAGKLMFRGTIDLSKIPQGISGTKIHVVLFPFTSQNRLGLSVQLSRKHHFQP